MTESNKNIAIEVKNLSKHFRLPVEQSSSIKQSFINLTKGIKGYKKQKVLRDISFNVEKGDFFGIVGRNGSGKSTLLKLISGIYHPDGGSVKINGSLVSFIELGVGFNPELTGRENIYLNGALMGFDTKQIDAMYDEIVEFAELGEFMDQKLKNYSSGMQVRLAFSCAIRAKSDILVLDEILAVGDEAFQRKCNDYFDKIKKDKNQTVILVTHGMDNVRKYCNKAIMIRDGKVVVSGSPEDVANEYSMENLEINQHKPEKEWSIVENLKVKLLSKKLINQKDKVKIKVSYQTNKAVDSYVVLNLQDLDRNNTILAGRSETVHSTKGKTITHTVTFDISKMNDTNFRVITSIRDPKSNIIGFCTESESPTFVLRRDDYKNPEKRETFAVLFDRGTWKKG